MGTKTINLKVLAPIKIKNIEIIKNGDVYKKIEVNSNFISTEIIDQDTIKEETYYYIRVNLDNGHLAWATPIWFI